MKRAICDEEINKLKEDLRNTLEREEGKFERRIFAEEFNFFIAIFRGEVEATLSMIPQKRSGRSISEFSESSIGEEEDEEFDGSCEGYNATHALEELLDGDYVFSLKTVQFFAFI